MTKLSVSVLSVLAFCTVYVACENIYTNKYDNFDVDKVLNNDRILSNYIKCLMDEGSCTNEGRELKKTIPDALAGECSKCSEKQKQTSEKVIKHVMTKRKRDWERLSQKYDPTGIYERKYKTILENPKTNTTNVAENAKDKVEEKPIEKIQEKNTDKKTTEEKIVKDTKKENTKEKEIQETTSKVEENKKKGDTKGKSKSN